MKNADQNINYFVDNLKLILQSVKQALNEIATKPEGSIEEIELHKNTDKIVQYFYEKNKIIAENYIKDAYKTQLSAKQDSIFDKLDILYFGICNAIHNVNPVNQDLQKYQSEICKLIPPIHLRVKKEVQASEATTIFRYPAFFIDLFNSNKNRKIDNILIIGPGVKSYNNKYYSFELALVTLLCPNAQIDVLEPNGSVIDDLAKPLSIDEYKAIKILFNETLKIDSKNLKESKDLNLVKDQININLNKIISGENKIISSKQDVAKINIFSTTLQNYKTEKTYDSIVCFNSIIYSLTHEYSNFNSAMFQYYLKSLLNKNGSIFAELNTVSKLMGNKQYQIGDVEGERLISIPNESDTFYFTGKILPQLAFAKDEKYYRQELPSSDVNMIMRGMPPKEIRSRQSSVACGDIYVLNLYEYSKSKVQKQFIQSKSEKLISEQYTSEKPESEKPQALENLDIKLDSLEYLEVNKEKLNDALNKIYEKDQPSLVSARKFFKI